MVLGLVTRWAGHPPEDTSARLAPPVIEVIQGGRVGERVSPTSVSAGRCRRQIACCKRPTLEAAPSVSRSGFRPPCEYSLLGLPEVQEDRMRAFTPVMVGVIVIVVLGLLVARTYGEYEALDRRLQREAEQQQREARREQREFDRATDELNDAERELRRQLRRTERSQRW